MSKMFLQLVLAVLVVSVASCGGLPPDEGNFLISGSVDFNHEFIYNQQRLICLLRCAVNALIAFKNAIYEDPFSVLSSWNGLSYCNWSGIYCSDTSDHVLTLNLSSLSLGGFMAPELCHLTYLRELILHNNTFVGTIPLEIGTLSYLKALDLSVNRLSGPIPPEFGNLTNMSKIYLQFNGLTGTIPSELGKLKNLVELRLDRNKLQGLLPGNHKDFASTTHEIVKGQNASVYCLSHQLSRADFSYNFFVGDIPMCLKFLPRSSFQGNCLEDKDARLQRSKQQCAGFQAAESPKPGKRSPEDGAAHHGFTEPSWLIVLEVVTGIAVILILLFGVITAFKRCRPKSSVIIPWKKTASLKEQMISCPDPELLKDVLRISRQDLEVACEDFSNIIGTSSDSVVYKGTMKGGPEIAVISMCIPEEHWTSYLELYFQREVADLARLKHENTGKLLGYCRESNPFSRMLVLQYASNGTLYEHLHYGEGGQLSWIRRMRIILGIAKGLKYLHLELQPPFTISDLNSSAVYLTDDFSPMLVDFERWKAIFSGKSTDSFYHGSAFVGLTDIAERHQTDIQGNTYAFGVLLMEIISGRPPYCKDRGYLADWAKEYLDDPKELSDLVDPELPYFRSDDLQVICEMAQQCLQSDPVKRPSMQLVYMVLENGIDLSPGVELKESPLAWAELAISSEDSK